MEKLEERHLDNGSLTNAEKGWYINCLVTLMLCLGFAMRSQVLERLTPSTLLPPSTGANEYPTQYQVRMSAHISKDGKAVLIVLPAELTGHISWYLRTLVPAGYTKSIFLQRGEQPRTNFTFTKGTKLVTKAMIGKAVTCHSFRHSTATVFSEFPEAERRDLARNMNHNFDTHNSTYTHRKRLKTQPRFQGYLLRKADELKLMKANEMKVAEAVRPLVGVKRPRSAVIEEEDDDEVQVVERQ